MWKGCKKGEKVAKKVKKGRKGWKKGEKVEKVAKKGWKGYKKWVKMLHKRGEKFVKKV